MKPGDLREWVQVMRELGVLSVTTGELSIQLDPTISVQAPTPEPEEERIEIEQQPGMCVKCNKEPAKGMIPGFCRTCTAQEVRRSVQ